MRRKRRFERGMVRIWRKVEKPWAERGGQGTMESDRLSRLLPQLCLLACLLIVGEATDDGRQPVIRGCSRRFCGFGWVSAAGFRGGSHRICGPKKRDWEIFYFSSAKITKIYCRPTPQKENFYKIKSSFLYLIKSFFCLQTADGMARHFFFSFWTM